MKNIKKFQKEINNNIEKILINQKKINLIKNDPTSRRIIINLWNPKTLHKAALPSCLCMYQFYVDTQHKLLNLQIYIRSTDYFLANNWNTCTGALFVHLICALSYINLTPGILTVVCGDSHTSTHGAFGSIAFGIGTSQVEQVMTTQCLLLQKPKRMRITIDGELQNGVLSKDIILYILSKLTASGGTGYFIEYAGSTIRSLSMEARMTICNMSIEMGARGGLIAPDEKTFNYIKGRKFAPQGEQFDKAVTFWKTLFTDEDAQFEREYNFKAEDITPMVTYGTNPGMGIKITEAIPEAIDPNNTKSYDKSLKYMNFKTGNSLIGQKINFVFIGSCTNSRIEDLRLVADFVKGKSKASNTTVWIVPGSKQVQLQAQEEGLDKVFEAAGFELREPGCSACLGMNEDKIPKGEYCISTSNRNFEGRQGQGARTILASPLMAAATAVTGKIVDVRELL